MVDLIQFFGKCRVGIKLTGYLKISRMMVKLGVRSIRQGIYRGVVKNQSAHNGKYF